MQGRGRYVMVMLAALGCGIAYRMKAGKSEIKHASASSSSDSERTDDPAPPPESQPAPAPQPESSPEPSAIDAGASDASTQFSATDTGIQRIRDLVVSNPKLAEQLVLAARERDPDGPEADERDALFVAAIFNQHQIDRARVEARRYFKHHPGGRYTDYLMRETGMHPPPVRTGQ